VAEADLDVLLRTMSPRRNPGTYVWATVRGALPAAVVPVVTVREAEGTTLVVERGAAERAGLAFEFPSAWITLTVHSALEAVGFTAAFSAALTRAGISANVVAGFHHDHVFVPEERADEAMRILLSSTQVGAARPLSGTTTAGGPP
jgi:hypothetical protein